MLAKVRTLLCVSGQRMLFRTQRSLSEQATNNENTTHFGFKTIPKDEKQQEVNSVFENVANSYDKMNDIMSMGIHRLWKDIFMRRLGPVHGSKLIDCAGGTGDITFRYLDYLRNIPNPNRIKSHVTVADINNNMLNVGKSRAKNQGYLNDENIEVQWEVCNAEELPFENDTYNAYTIAFGIRNVTCIDKVLSEAYRVLTPGGRFLCLEFSHVKNDLFRWVYDKYSFQVIPVMGTVVTGQWDAYQYLVESIRKFPEQEEFKGMIEAAGFRSVTYENLTCGVVAIHSGFKI